VRRIGGQGTLHIQRFAQAPEQLVDAVAHRAQLLRHVGQVQRLQVAAAAGGDLLLQAPDAVQFAPRDPVDQPGQHRQHDQQHSHQAQQRALAGLVALFQRVGQLQPDTVRRIK
jgi:hypothetical protein